MSINNWTFSGRIGRDAESRYSQSGKEIVSAAVAVDQGWGDNKKTMWVDAVMFGERFGKIAQYLTKGTKVTIIGEAGLNKYTAKDGSEKSSIQCIVRDIDFSSGQQQSQQSQRQQSAPAAAKGRSDDPFDDMDGIDF